MALCGEPRESVGVLAVGAVGVVPGTTIRIICLVICSRISFSPAGLLLLALGSKFQLSFCNCFFFCLIANILVLANTFYKYGRWGGGGVGGGRILIESPHEEFNIYFFTLWQI